MHGWIKIRFEWIWRNLKKRFNYNFEHSYQDKTPCYLFVHFSVVNYRGAQLGGHYLIIDGSEHNWIPSCKPVFEPEIVIQSYNPSYP